MTISLDSILYIALGVATLSALLAQRLTTTTTGPRGVIAATTALRLAIIGLWIWFGLASGYWQIAALVGLSGLINIAGVLAKGKGPVRS